jgi:membrane-associated phospholipid phosphatase
VANELAAMPSLHLAWAVWSAWAVFVVWRGRKGIWLVWCYPVLTTLDVLSTGNHFVADVVAGALTAAAAISLGRLLPRGWQAGRARIQARAAAGREIGWDGAFAEEVEQESSAVR